MLLLKLMVWRNISTTDRKNVSTREHILEEVIYFFLKHNFSKTKKVLGSNLKIPQC